MKKNDLTVKYVSIIHAVAHIDNLGADNERRKRLTQMQMILQRGGGGRGGDSPKRGDIEYKSMVL